MNLMDVPLLQQRGYYAHTFYGLFVVAVKHSQAGLDLGLFGQIT